MARQSQNQMPDPGMSGMELVQSGAQLVRALNDQMASVAVARPRQPKTIIAEAIEELEAIPGLARDAYYVLPFRSKKGQQVNVEGPSVHAAVALMRHWGHSAVTCRIDELAGERAVLTGIFLDVQTNTRFEAPLVVSRFERNHDTGQYSLLNDDRWQTKIQAGVSKAIRNAILKGIPRALSQHYKETAKAIVAKQSSAEMRGRGGKASVLKSVRDDFKQYGITDEVLCYYAGKIDRLEDITSEGLAELRGLYNALRDGVRKPQELIDGALGAATAEPGGDVEVEIDGWIEEDDRGGAPEQAPAGQ